LGKGFIVEHAWQLQDAKNKLSEVIERAIKNGPQEITRRGKKAAVLLSFQEYARLLKGTGSLAEFFHQSPLREIKFDRVKDRPREVDL
jgi:prevent-host-death family protein